MFNQEDVLIPFNTSRAFRSLDYCRASCRRRDFWNGSTLLKAKQQGIETHLVVLTDGSQGGKTDDLVEVRRKEVRKAADLLGIASLKTWSEPDRFLETNSEIVTRVTELILEICPRTVFFPGPLEIHPDHRAACVLVWKALQKAKISAQPPTPISYEISVQNPINMLIDITPQIEEKKRVMHSYISQNAENNYPELVVALDKGRTFSLPHEVKFAEGFFKYEKKDLSLSVAEMIRGVIDLYVEIV